MARLSMVWRMIRMAGSKTSVLLASPEGQSVMCTSSSQHTKNTSPPVSQGQSSDYCPIKVRWNLRWQGLMVGMMASSKASISSILTQRRQPSYLHLPTALAIPPSVSAKGSTSSRSNTDYGHLVCDPVARKTEGFPR